MASTAGTIDHTSFERLIEAGAVHGADVVGHPGGWGIVVKYGMTERTLAARRGAVRTFRKFETLVRYLKGVGIAQYNVNASEFNVESLKTTRVRPDSSERMRQAFESKAHADWMQQKVTESLADSGPHVSHVQVMSDAQAMIDAKRKKHASHTDS
jgi:hypothetical protein